MANLMVWAQTNVLNWLCNATAVTQPSSQFIGLSLTAPTSAASNEVGTGSGYSRASVVFGVATTAGGVGSISNSGAMTFGPFSSSTPITGLFMVVGTNAASTGSGTGVMFGNLTTPRTPLAGDSLVLAAGALSITIS